MDTTNQLLLDKLIAAVSEYKASDLHLVAGNFPILRVDGKLTPLSSEQPLTAEFLSNVVASWLNEKQKEILDRNKEIIFSYTTSNKMRFKISIYYQQGTLSISLKAIPQQVKNILELGLPREVQSLLTLKKGLIIITGPFGSGKSTTINSIIEHFNQNEAKHIITIEDPVEYVFVDNQSIIEQREVGNDTPSYLDALRFILEEDVDIVVLPELEGGTEAIKQVFKIVDSGRLVIAGMNTESSAKTLESVINNFQTSEQANAQEKLASVLTAVIVQKIIPGLQGTPILAHELLVPNQAAKSVIESGEFIKLNNIMSTTTGEGMITFDRSLADLVQSGTINLAVALEHAHDKEYFQSLVSSQQ